MSTMQELSTATITRRWKLAGGSAVAAAPNLAVLIQNGAHTSADLVVEELLDHSLDVTTVRVDRGDALPIVESVAFAVVLSSDEHSGELDPSLVGWIAEADAAGVAIFAIGTGVQFHPEATPALIRDWVTRSRRRLEAEGIDEATVLAFPAAKPAADRLFDAFIDLALAA